MAEKKSTKTAPKKSPKKATKKDESLKVINKGYGYCTMQLSEICRENKGIIEIENFYTAVIGEIYSNGRFNICKDCMKEYVYDLKGEIDLNRLKKVLRIYDLPFLHKAFNTAFNGTKETLGSYMRCINLNHGDKTWMDSDGLNLSIESFKGEEFIVTNEIKRRWGKGKSDEDYQWLEDTYAEWLEKNKSDTMGEQKTFKYITMKEFEIMKGWEVHDNTKDAEDSLRKFMSNANVVPKEIKEITGNESDECYGVYIKEIEKFRPAEFFEKLKLYFDFDGLIDYLNRFVFRPLKNLLLKTKEYDKEFNINEPSGFKEDMIDGKLPEDSDDVGDSDDMDF